MTRLPLCPFPLTQPVGVRAVGEQPDRAHEGARSPSRIGRGNPLRPVGLVARRLREQTQGDGGASHARGQTLAFGSESPLTEQDIIQRRAVRAARAASEARAEPPRPGRAAAMAAQVQRGPRDLRSGGMAWTGRSCATRGSNRLPNAPLGQKIENTSRPAVRAAGAAEGMAIGRPEVPSWTDGGPSHSPQRRRYESTSPSWPLLLAYSADLRTRLGQHRALNVANGAARQRTGTGTHTPPSIPGAGATT